MRILAIIGAVLLGALLIFIGAFGARWFAPPGAEPAVPVVADTPDTAGSDALDLETLRELLLVADQNRRAEILASPENFEQFVTQETLNQAVLNAAYANEADQNEAIRVLMQRAGQRVLAETYLNQVVRLNLDDAFPSEAQVREAYDNNPDAFRVPERIHLWQIFIEIPEGASADERAAASKRAKEIADTLRAGKGDFASLAKQHSGHEQSRVNDGYMGLVQVSELLPVIAEAAAKLELDQVSAPIATATGLHIIRKGATVNPELIDFNKVKDNLRERLRREAALRVRQAALEKIAEEYPVAPPAEDLEVWRERLREQLRPQAVPAPAG